MTIKGSLYGRTPMLKQFSTAKKCPDKIGPQKGGFPEI